MRPLVRLAAIAALLAAAAPASAQYSFNPDNPDEQDGSTRYFGSVKDDKGKLVEGATILVNHAWTFVSDESGRYIGYAPSDISPKTVLIGCGKPGYAFVRLSKRDGVTPKKKVWVQADCVLRKQP